MKKPYPELPIKITGHRCRGGYIRSYIRKIRCGDDRYRQRKLVGYCTKCGMVLEDYILGKVGIDGTAKGTTEI